LARNVSPMQALEDELVQAMMVDTGLQAAMARFMVAPIIRHLCSEYGGDRIYIPKAREIPAADIVAAFNTSRDVQAVCTEFGISRATLYRLLGQSD
jgi:Mor family transcriptional regulator